MAQTLRTLIEQTWYMASETVNVSVADQDGTNTRTISSTGAWYRTRLVASGGTSGTLDSPHSLTAKFQAALNTSASRYSVRYQSDGTIGITYNGTGTSVITWGTNGAKLRRMLGFAESSTTSIATNATTSGTYHPCGSVLSGALIGGNGYTTEPAGVAAALAADGRTYAVSAQANVMRMKRTLQYHPFTWSARTDLADYPTPIYVGALSGIPSVTAALALYQPWTSCASSGGGIWSVNSLVTTAVNVPVAICPHDFADVRTTSEDNVLVGWLTPECLNSAAAQSLSIANYLKRMDWRDFELSITSNITVGSP